MIASGAFFQVWIVWKIMRNNSPKRLNIYISNIFIV